MLVPKYFGSKRILDPKKIWVQMNLGYNKFRVMCSNLTNDAHGAHYGARGALGAHSLVGKFHPYFDLLARSFRKYDWCTMILLGARSTC